MHELEVFCEMTFFDFKLPIFCTAFSATPPRTIDREDSSHEIVTKIIVAQVGHHAD
jgi:hypothetical protein